MPRPHSTPPRSHSVSDRSTLDPAKSVVVPGWGLADDSQATNIYLDIQVVPTVRPEVVLPPATIGKLRNVDRVSEHYPAPPAEDEFPGAGEWRRDDLIRIPWGRVRIILDGKDVTFLRDKLSKVVSFSSNEPFGDADCTLMFPQFTPWENISVAGIKRWATVRLELVGPNESHTLWDGSISEYNYTDRQGWNVTCVGAFYELDYLIKRPDFYNPKKDVADIIQDEVNAYLAVLPQIKLHTMDSGHTGVQLRKRGSYERMVTGWMQDLLGKTQMASDPYKAYTIECSERQPKIVEKSMTYGLVTMVAGQPGLNLGGLHQDLKEATNVVYGEGSDALGHHWRNTKMPFLWDGDISPVAPGVSYYVGQTDPNIGLFFNSLIISGFGWDGNINGDNTYQANEEKTVRNFQRLCGLTVDGIIGTQTWNAAFNPGTNGGRLDGTYTQALHWMPHVEPFLFNQYGGWTGFNPAYDPTISPRIEKYFNFGSGVDLNDGFRSAINRIDRDWSGKDGDVSSGGYTDPDDPGEWSGTIELEADPWETSRFDLRAGMNLKVKHWQGTGDTGMIFHITRAEHDMDRLTTSLTVDTQWRDLQEVAALLSRDRDTEEDMAFKLHVGRQRTSVVTEDNNIAWDSDSRMGHMYRMGIPNQLWTVIRIPTAEWGTIAKAEFFMETPAEFSVAAFRRYVTPNHLLNLGRPDDDGYWEQTELDDLGLIVGWGGAGQMGGYWPKTQDDGDLTGVLKDDSSWNYFTDVPGWLWLAFWCERSNYLTGGRLYPIGEFETP